LVAEEIDGVAVEAVDKVAVAMGVIDKKFVGEQVADALVADAFAVEVVDTFAAEAVDALAVEAADTFVVEVVDAFVAEVVGAFAAEVVGAFAVEAADTFVVEAPDTLAVEATEEMNVEMKVVDRLVAVMDVVDGTVVEVQDLADEQVVKRKTVVAVYRTDWWEDCKSFEDDHENFVQVVSNQDPSNTIDWVLNAVLMEEHKLLVIVQNVLVIALDNDADYNSIMMYVLVQRLNAKGYCYINYYYHLYLIPVEECTYSRRL
jgi:hypothetical protein